MVSKELSNIRKKIRALQYEGVPSVISDLFEIIAQSISEQTGLKIKQEGKELIAKDFVDQLLALYKLQEQDFLEAQDDGPVQQLDIEAAIELAKTGS